MLKDNAQMTLDLFPYQGLYDVIIPKDHLLRKLKENIDFSFVNSMLRKQYCEHFGRPAKEPEMKFKLLFLKNCMIFPTNDLSPAHKRIWHISTSLTCLQKTR